MTDNSENPYTGKVPLKIGDQDGILFFDWDAITIVKTTISDDELTNLAQISPDKLAILAAAGFQKHCPDITADIVKAACPPIMEVATAVDRALLIAYHGPENARTILEPLDKMNADMDAKVTKKPATKKKSAKKKTTS